MRFSQSVLFVTCLAACATPRERSAPGSTGPAALAMGTSAAPAPPPVPPPAAPPPAAPLPAAVASMPSTNSAPAPVQTPTGSAYLGCGVALPVDKLWDETTEAQVMEAITAAKSCAREHGRRLLLEFVAPWCADCREMARLDETPLVSRTLAARFERVRVNVGKWDRHEALRENYRVRALATYVVIDPKTSRVLAQTTLEPITRQRGTKLTAEDWATWLGRH